MTATKTTMKAIRVHGFGGPDVLRYEDAPMPRLQPGEVLVRVNAVGVNPPDWYLRDGYRTLPAEWRPTVALPVIPGSDVSGVVEAVGAGATGFDVGDEVFGMVRFPGYGQSAAYAEHVAAPAVDLARKPSGLTHVQAAGVPMAALTAWQFLVEPGHDQPNPFQPEPHRPVPLKGRRVLVNGAAGGVGHMAVQVARWQGAHVVAVASGRHEAFLHELGVDGYIDYTRTAPHEAVSELDLVVDTVGGPATSRFLRALRRGGALFPVYPLGFDGADEARRRGVTVSAAQVRSNGAQLAEVAALIDQGVLRVAIDSTFPLALARKAHERAAQGSLQGKIVLTVD